MLKDNDIVVGNYYKLDFLGKTNSRIICQLTNISDEDIQLLITDVTGDWQKYYSKGDSINEQLDDLKKHYGLVPAYDSPLWKVLHSNEDSD